MSLVSAMHVAGLSAASFALTQIGPGDQQKSADKAKVREQRISRHEALDNSRKFGISFSLKKLFRMAEVWELSPAQRMDQTGFGSCCD